MKRFIVFWDSENDQEDVAQGYCDEAMLHAKKIGKALQTKLVDVDKSDPDKSFWDSPDTIECVTTDDGTKKETALNPEDDKIDEMVDNI